MMLSIVPTWPIGNAQKVERCPCSHCGSLSSCLLGANVGLHHIFHVSVFICKSYKGDPGLKYFVVNQIGLLSLKFEVCVVFFPSHFSIFFSSISFLADLQALKESLFYPDLLSGFVQMSCKELTLQINFARFLVI